MSRCNHIFQPSEPKALYHAYPGVRCQFCGARVDPMSDYGRTPPGKPNVGPGKTLKNPSHQDQDQ